MRWTDERITRELADFAEQLGYRPVESDFQRAGRADLLSAMTRHGGRARWLATLDLPPAPDRRVIPVRCGPVPQQSRPRWTDEELGRELRLLAAKDGYFPTASDLRAAGRADLRDALRRYGGTVVWADRLGLKLRPGQDRRPYGPQDAVADARRVIAERGRLPNTDAIRSGGYPRLATFIATQCGGVARFISEHLEQA